MKLLKKIVHLGIQILLQYHTFDCHSTVKEDVKHYKGDTMQSIVNEVNLVCEFMKIFGYIKEENDFKDLVQYNIETIFVFLLRIQDDNCNLCKTNFLFIPFKCDKNNETIYFSVSRQIYLILMNYFLAQMKDPQDSLDPFHKHYESYKNRYFCLIH
jgi:hypothetical protein